LDPPPPVWDPVTHCVLASRLSDPFSYGSSVDSCGCTYRRCMTQRCFGVDWCRFVRSQYNTHTARLIPLASSGLPQLLCMSFDPRRCSAHSFFLFVWPLSATLSAAAQHPLSLPHLLLGPVASYGCFGSVDVSIAKPVQTLSSSITMLIHHDILYTHIGA